MREGEITKSREQGGEAYIFLLESAFSAIISI
jgi:hypothetical protein